VEEKEAVVELNCYFWKEGVLMRKWRSPVISASDEWNILYQIVLSHGSIVMRYSVWLMKLQWLGIWV